jgi:hypothetical protein
MFKILNRRIIALQIIATILILSLLIPSVNCTKIDKVDKKINVILSSEDSNLLLERFYMIEQEYNGIEKIKKQIEILDENNVFSNKYLLNNFFRAIELFDNSNLYRCKNNGVFIGPTIIAHFIPRGSIIGTSFNRSWYLDKFTKNLTGLMNGKVLDGIVGALPIYIGFSLKPVFITAVSRSCSNFYSTVFFPFFEVMLPCIGFSIRIKNESNAIIFEYNLDFCLFAVLKGFTSR